MVLRPEFFYSVLANPVALCATLCQAQEPIADQISGHDIVQQFGFQKYQDSCAQSECRTGRKGLCHACLLVIGQAAESVRPNEIDTDLSCHISSTFLFAQPRGNLLHFYDMRA